MATDRVLFQPFLASMLRDRRISVGILAALGVHMTLVMFDLPGWPCPIRQALNIPCPGCGLSRAARLLLRGSWDRALEVHVFAPVFVLGLLALGVSLLLPSRLYADLIARLDRFERIVPIIALILASIVMYWALRMLFFSDRLYMLVM
jgi:hypothetical protein